MFKQLATLLTALLDYLNHHVLYIQIIRFGISNLTENQLNNCDQICKN